MLHHTFHPSKSIGLLWLLVACVPTAARSAESQPTIPRKSPVVELQAEVPVTPEKKAELPAPKPKQPAIHPSLSKSEQRALSPDECYQLLDDREILYKKVVAKATFAPVVPTGPVAGITWIYNGTSETHATMDCRLLLALGTWGNTLSEASVVSVRHLSALRPKAKVRKTNKPSGHSKGMAVDLRFFVLEDGTELDILSHWQDRKRGVPPCEGDHERADAGAKLLRKVLCQAVKQKLFDVVVTPHHDSHHQNHLHVEIAPNVDWQWVR